MHWLGHARPAIVLLVLVVGAAGFDAVATANAHELSPVGFLTPTSTSHGNPVPLVGERASTLRRSDVAGQLALVRVDEPLRFEQAPGFVASPQCTLAGRLTFRASRPCQAVVEIRQGARSWQVPHHSRPEEEHEVLILGLRANRTHELIVRLSSGTDSHISEPVEVTPPPLPAEFPNMRITRSDPARMEPGVTLFNPLRWESDVSSKFFGLFLAVDSAGEVMWYHQIDAPSGAMRRLRNGNLLYLFGTRPMGMREISLTGETVCEWWATGIDDIAPEGAIEVPVDTFHHDVWEMDNGNLLVLSTEVRQIENFTISESSPDRGFAPANVVGDVIVELQRDGTIVRDWRLLDLLDSRRISYDSHDRYWDLRGYGHLNGGTRDWSHANAIVYDERDDSLLVSLRHQDALVKIDYESADVRWILGARRGWRGALGRKVLRPSGSFDLPYHTHAPEFTPHGTLLVFDNGNHRTVPPFPKMAPEDSYSRAVEFHIDEERGTATQVWAYGGPGVGRFFAAFLGDTNLMPTTGNVLVTIGGTIVDDRGRPTVDLPGAAQFARIVEVTHDDPAEVLFELIIDDRETRPEIGWSVYRAQRIPDLIPLPAVN